MAALMAALGLVKAAKHAGEGKAENQGTASANASPKRKRQTYFEKLAAEIVALSPVFGKARVPIIASHRDKESLLVEIIDLKKAVEETTYHLRLHRQHYLRSLEESRRLEREVEELELKGNFDAPRTGGVVRLESRCKGLGAQVDVLEDIVAERKYGELAQLRKGLGATHSREMEIERDTIAAEISRLKIYLNHIKKLNEEAKEEMDNLKFCKRHLARLTVENPKVQRSIEAVKASIQRAKDEIEKLKEDGEENKKTIELMAEVDEKYSKRVEELSAEARKVALEKRKIQKMNDQLGYDRMIFNQDFRREHPGIPKA